MTFTKIDIRKTERIGRIRYVFAPIAGLFVAGICAAAWAVFIHIGKLPVILPIFMGVFIGSTIRKISDTSCYSLASAAVAETIFAVIAGRYLAFCWLLSDKLGISFIKMIWLNPVGMNEFIVIGKYLSLRELMEILIIFLGILCAWFTSLHEPEKK